MLFQDSSIHIVECIIDLNKVVGAMGYDVDNRKETGVDRLEALHYHPRTSTSHF